MNRKKHVFLLTRYSKLKVYAISPNTDKRYSCVMSNGMYMTNDDDEKEALLNSRYYGIDFILDETLSDEAKENLVMENAYGDNAQLAKKLSGKTRQELVSLANKVKAPGMKNNDFFKKSKDDLIDYLLQKQHKLEAV